MLLVMVLFFIEKYVGHHAISKFKLWLTVMEYIYSKENAAYVAIKSHRRSSFPVLTPELKKMGEAAVLVKSCDYLVQEQWSFIRRK
jgi:hypothetical protein